ncbi:MAG: hypothetical protein JO295_01585, partial [Verrucomicrobia bacterium]|nr:hypothetical protein [Verrucomicrobiota bacterium]
MTETTPLTRDLARLAGRAYHAGEWNVALLRRYHAWVAGAPGRAEEPRLARLYPWLFVPPTLWPFHIADALAGCLAALEADKRVSPRLRLAVELLPEPPSDPICRAVAEHEHHVQAGRYEHLLTSPAKYQQLAATVRDNPALLADWARLKAAFPVARYRDHKGVIRRSMATERNLRAGFGLPAHSGPRVLFT